MTPAPIASNSKAVQINVYWDPVGLAPPALVLLATVFQEVWQDSCAAQPPLPCRPLFVAEADFKPCRLLAPKVRQALLVLQGTDLLVLQAIQASNGDADNNATATTAAAAVLRHIQYSEVNCMSQNMHINLLTFPSF